MAEYDENKQYKWEETDEFVLNGSQFGLILNSFRQILSKPSSQEVLLAMRSEKEMTDILKKGVESGTIKEITEPAVNQPKMVKT